MNNGTNYRWDPPMYIFIFYSKFDIFLHGLNVTVQFWVDFGNIVPVFGLTDI